MYVEQNGFERCVSADGSVGYRAQALSELDVPHWFTTRVGPSGSELDAARLSRGDHPSWNHTAGFEPEVRPALARQVHGADCAVVDADSDVSATAADALTTRSTSRRIGVVTADCVPVLVADVEGRHVAAIHAGWRGLVAGVIPRTLRRFDGVELAAAIGPCLSLGRFEVGPEVAVVFEAQGLGAAVHADYGERPHIDLSRAASLQLERAGVRRISASERCTWSDPELWSYRRDVTHGGAQSTGRLSAWIAPRADSSR